MNHRRGLVEAERPPKNHYCEFLSTTDKGRNSPSSMGLCRIYFVPIVNSCMHEQLTWTCRSISKSPAVWSMQLGWREHCEGLGLSLTEKDLGVGSWAPEPKMRFRITPDLQDFDLTDKRRSVNFGERTLWTFIKRHKLLQDIR